MKNLNLKLVSFDDGNMVMLDDIVLFSDTSRYIASMFYSELMIKMMVMDFGNFDFGGNNAINDK